MDIQHLYGHVNIAGSAIVGEHCTLGYPKEARLAAAVAGQTDVGQGSSVSLGEHCLVFNNVVIYEGVQIGDGCVIDDNTRIGYNCTVGPNSRIVYGAFVCDRVTIGTNARIAGFICDGASIGDRSTVMGELVHEYTSPHEDWWKVDEAPPTIGSDVIVGYGARVIGGVTIAPRSYVAAGAIVTKDVPTEHVVTGVNTQIPASRWEGQRLQRLIDHWTSYPTRTSM